MEPMSRQKVLAHACFLLVVLLSILALLPRGTSDIAVWRYWAQTSQEQGFRSAYNNPAVLIDQPPLGIFMLSALPRVLEPLGIPAYRWEAPGLSGFKVTTLLFLWVSALITLAMTRSLPLSAALLLALLLNVVLGYFDLYFVPTLLLGLWALRARRWCWASLFLTLTCLIKWQPLLLLPFAIPCLFDEHPDTPFPRRALVSLLLPGAVLAGAFVVFCGPGMLRALHLAATHRFLSGNALNFNWLLTCGLHLVHPAKYGPLGADGLCSAIKVTEWRVIALPKLLFLTAYLALWLLSLKKSRHFHECLAAALLAFLAYFTFNTGVHENHLVPALLLAFLLFRENTRTWPLLLALALLANLNLFLFYGLTGDGPPSLRLLGVDTTLPAAALEVLLFLAAFFRFIRTPSHPASHHHAS